MRSITLRAKKPAWVRIVNPDPIRILDMRWRYGDHVRIAPGGAFHTITDPAPKGRDKRVLTMYQPPHAPAAHDDAPPDALVLHTMEDLRLLSEGVISFEEKYDPTNPTWPGRSEGATTVRMGETAGVPRPRVVRAMFPPIVREVPALIPYREGVEVEIVNRVSERKTIRPGGTMTVFTDGAPPCARLKVRYRADAECGADQCETGAWFYLAAADFLRMKDEAARTADLEALERAIVRHLLTQAY